MLKCNFKDMIASYNKHVPEHLRLPEDQLPTEDIRLIVMGILKAIEENDSV